MSDARDALASVLWATCPPEDETDFTWWAALILSQLRDRGWELRASECATCQGWGWVCDLAVGEDDRAWGCSEEQCDANRRPCPSCRASAPAETGETATVTLRRDDERPTPHWVEGAVSLAETVFPYRHSHGWRVMAEAAPAETGADE